MRHETPCPHCFPLIRYTHPSWERSAEKFSEAVESVVRSIVPARIRDRLGDQIWHGILSFLLWTKIATLDSAPDESQLFNRSLIFFREAKRRGLDVAAVKMFGRYPREFCFTWQGRRYFYNEIPTFIHSPPCAKFDDKEESKKFFERHGLPFPTGRSFRRASDGLRFGRALGFPLAVKPRNGSLSAHATYPVNDECALQTAIEVAQEYQPEFIVEKFIPGDLYRATVVGRSHVFVCRKDAPSVTGDGASTVAQLVAQKNADSRRGDPSQKQFTLHRLPVIHDGRVPAKGEQVFLHDKKILSLGCDIVACTADIHPDNRALFLSAARLIPADFVGFDFICGDIRRPYRKQACGFIEINSLPYADMHACPSEGVSDPIAEAVWDAVMEKMC